MSPYDGAVDEVESPGRQQSRLFHVEALPDRPFPSRRAAVVTTLAFGTVGLVLVRRLPRPVRPVADVALAATAPYVAHYLTRIGV